MRVLLNNFVLNDPSKRVYINEDIEGLDIPSIRTSKGVRTGQSGGYIGAQFYDPRAVTINGTIFADSVSQALEKRRAIQAALPLFPQTITVRIEDDDGRAYTFVAQVIDFKMPIGRKRIKSIFKLELEAPDSVIYDDTAGSALTATISQAVPGGLHFSTTSPQFGSTFYFSAGQPLASVVNPSDLTTYAVITINGATTNPVLINRTTGETFRLNNYSVGAGSKTEIDMMKHTVKLNGGNVLAYAPTNVDWWGLVPGTNEIEFTSASGGDVTQAALSWRPGYRGI